MRSAFNSKGNPTLEKWIEAEEQNLQRSLYKGKLSIDERRNMKNYHQALHQLTLTICKPSTTSSSVALKDSNPTVTR
jgi:hypothetical protein